ncbi:MAG: 2-oxoacid:ferredoxin oxidoreductase subunit beta, partial [Phycisphaerales bacterium JB063]
ALQKVLPELGVRKEDIAIISGIGCSSRLPYYIDAYGFHTIHGRPLTVATGLKAANPKLSVWVITGDGDSLSIGGNHLIHALRRNLDVNVLLFNNRIYGLTKGQYSPTSEQGKRTKSTPVGSIDRPFAPLSLALGAGATFMARTIDRDAAHMSETFLRAAEHHGTSLIEIYQNCNIFNDGAFDYATGKDTREDNVVYLEHGKPLIFGKNSDKGIRVVGCRPEVVTLGEGGVSEDDLLFHDETNRSMAMMLAELHHPEFPEPMGVLYREERPTYEDQLHAQIGAAVDQRGAGKLDALLNAGDVYEVV